jgi:hypothetical protein
VGFILIRKWFMLQCLPHQYIFHPFDTVA